MIETILLPARPESDLSWKNALSLAASAIERGDKISWEFDLGLGDPSFQLDDELTFQTLGAALKHFSNTIFPQFQHATHDAVLYRGPIDSRAESLAAYFQMLAHRLPDELSLSLIFVSAPPISLSEIVQLLSKDRFEHFHVEAPCLPFPLYGGAPLALCFPEESNLESFERLIALQKRPFCVLYESFLTEQWDGVDTIVVISENLGAKGKRKLLGFCAAGGRVVTLGEPIGVPGEISWETFGAEGFEPPA